jgi:hypothetical protein
MKRVWSAEEVVEHWSAEPVSLYGTFDLNLDERLDLGAQVG